MAKKKKSSTNAKKPKPQVVGPKGKIKSLKYRREFVEELVKRWRVSNPNPKCELYYETPFQLLVSVVLSAQTTDKSVNACMVDLHKSGLNARKILKLGVKKFESKIKTIGLAPTKAKNILKLSQIIEEQYHGEIPSTRQELEALPGVGRKTANVILGEIFREPTLAVDTHVYRVGLRLGLHAEKTPEKAEATLMKVVAADHLPDAHHWFILHGRYTCKAQKPGCDNCILNDICPSNQS